MQLNVKLRDGFKNSTVAVTVDGKPAYRETGVTSDFSTSTAAVIEVDVSSSKVVLEIRVEGGPAKSQTIQVDQTPFVDVWCMDGRLDIRTSAEEVPML